MASIRTLATVLFTVAATSALAEDLSLSQFGLVDSQFRMLGPGQLSFSLPPTYGVSHLGAAAHNSDLAGIKLLFAAPDTTTSYAGLLPSQASMDISSSALHLQSFGTAPWQLHQPIDSGSFGTSFGMDNGPVTLPMLVPHSPVLQQLPNLPEPSWR